MEGQYMTTNFDKIEFKFKIIRKDKPEPELIIDLIVFKGSDFYPIEIFDKDSLSEDEKLKFKLLEEERDKTYKKFNIAITNNKQMWVNFIKNVEESPLLYHKTRCVGTLNSNAFINFNSKQFKKVIAGFYKDSFQFLSKNAKISGDDNAKH